MCSRLTRAKSGLVRSARENANVYGPRWQKRACATDTGKYRAHTTCAVERQAPTTCAGERRACTRGRIPSSYDVFGREPHLYEACARKVHSYDACARKSNPYDVVDFLEGVRTAMRSVQCPFRHENLAKCVAFASVGRGLEPMGENRTRTSVLIAQRSRISVVFARYVRISATFVHRLRVADIFAHRLRMNDVLAHGLSYGWHFRPRLSCEHRLCPRFSYGGRSRPRARLLRDVGRELHGLHRFCTTFPVSNPFQICRKKFLRAGESSAYNSPRGNARGVSSVG